MIETYEGTNFNTIHESNNEIAIYTVFYKCYITNRRQILFRQVNSPRPYWSLTFFRTDTEKVEIATWDRKHLAPLARERGVAWPSS